MNTTHLLELTKKNGAFSKKTPGLQLVWDSTSIGLLKTCPWKYYLKMIEGWVPKKTPMPLLYGILFHECMEKYDYAICEGKSHNEAVRIAVRHALFKAGNYVPKTCGCVQCDGTAHARLIEVEGQDEPTEWCYVCGNCGLESKPHSLEDEAPDVFQPWEPIDTKRTRETIVRAVVWYLDVYGEKDPAKTIVLANGKPAVELSFRFDIDLESPEDGPYQLAGHMDRLAAFADQNWTVDHKTSASSLTQRFFQQFTPNNQMSLYTLAGKVALGVNTAGCLINGVELAVNFNRFQRGFASRTPKQVDEWLDDLKIWISLAETYAKLGHWPMNDTACGNYGGCEFRDVCAKDPQVRDRFLSADFRRKVWDPTVSRGV